MNRGLARQPIFQSDDSCRTFLKVLAEAHSRFELQMHAYCLMGNHYHMLVHTPLGNLGRAMRHINGVYTQRHNRMQGRDGPLFRGRYKAILIDADSYLLAVSRYIHRNPMETSRPLVSKLEDYSWSSYPAYLNRVQPPEWLYRNFTFGVLGRRDKYRAYRAYVEQGVEAEVRDFYQSERQSPVLGDGHFREKVMANLPEASPEVARWERETRNRPSCEEIVAAVAEVFAIDSAAIYERPRRGRGAWYPERAVAMWLCRDKAGLSLQEIGCRFGGVHYSAVSHAINRLKSRMEEGSSVAGMLKSIMSRFDPP